MTRPILHLKKPTAALLARPVAAGVVVTPPPVLRPTLSDEEEEEQRHLQRTRRLIAAVEAHTQLPPETLGRALLLPKHYRPDHEPHAVLLTAAIQLWIEGHNGDAAFSAAEERQVIERAQARYGFADPAFVRPSRSNGQRPDGQRGKTREGKTREQSAPDLGSRAQRWARLADDMAKSNLPHALVAALASMEPVSRHELSQMLENGRLQPLQLSATQETDLRGWLRLPSGKKRRRRSRNRRVKDFAKAANAWVQNAAKAGGAP